MEPEAVLTLKRKLDLKAAEPLTDDLIALRGRPLALDASGVECIGGFCLQVLLSGAAAWRDDGVPLRVQTPSEAFVAQLAVFGLDLSDITAAPTAH